MRANTPIQGSHNHTRRRAFTLVEMLVAMALTVFIMVIISTAFVTALETFRGLKGIGDLQESLRTAANRLRADLQADHFDGKKRLSDPLFWTDSRPRQGFFAVRQTTPSTAGANNEGLDLDNVPSFRAADHVLHLTVRLRGPRGQDYFSTLLPPGSPLLAASTPTAPTTFFGQPPDTQHQLGNVYTSQWAEVAYFLAPTPLQTGVRNPLTLYKLYRVQRLVTPRSEQANAANIAYAGGPTGTFFQYYQNVSCTPNAGNTLTFYSPEDMAADPTKRGFAAGNLPGTVWSDPPGDFDPGNPNKFFGANDKYRDISAGASLLMLNVVSFHVQVLKSGQTDFQDVTGSPNAVFDTAAAGGGVTGGGPPGYTVRAVRIVVRVWDPNTEQTRQVTIIQDL